jgi:hypothetical protein
MSIRLFIAVLSSFCAAQAASLSVSPSNMSLATGQSINLDINVNSVADLYAYEFDLKFDPTVLQALSVSESAFLSAGGTTFFLPGTIDNVGGLVTFNADSLLGFFGVSGSGTLAEFDFLAIAAGSTSIDIQNALLLDSTLAGIAVDVSGGIVTVGAPEPSYTPLYLVVGAAGVLFGRFRFSALRG